MVSFIYCTTEKIFALFFISSGLKRGVCSQINHFPEDADYDQDAAEYLLRESHVIKLINFVDVSHLSFIIFSLFPLIISCFLPPRCSQGLQYIPHSQCDTAAAGWGMCGVQSLLQEQETHYLGSRHSVCSSRYAEAMAFKLGLHTMLGF